MKRIFRYLKGTAECKLTIGAISEHEPIVAFSDASHASDKQDRKSTSGALVHMGAGALVWASRKQKSVALSSGEAEYVAIGECVREALWVRALFKEIGFGERPITLMTDSTVAYYVAGQPSSGVRRRHIDVQHHFIKDYVDQHIITLRWVPASEQLADVLTKPQQKSAIDWFRRALFSAYR